MSWMAFLIAWTVLSVALALGIGAVMARLRPTPFEMGIEPSRERTPLLV